ncbi:MAG: hypothetical protein E7447_06085 [Ruminococcaceae bacterium]|nr:hypothetical protein [Oscillospiraceae bacterium]
MKKLSKIFAVALCLAMVLSMMVMNASAASETLTFDFTSLAGDGYEIKDDKVQTTFENAASGEGLTSVTMSKVYGGNNSTSGAFPSNYNMLKTGTGSADAEIVMTFAKKVTKIEITCHDWYTKSDKYPTNHNFVSVNGSEEVLAPYTEDATLGVLTFEFDATETVTITTNNDDGKGGRVFITKMVVTFEGDNTQEPPKGGGDHAPIVAMTSVMAVAVVAMAVLVLGKKKFF